MKAGVNAVESWWRDRRDVVLSEGLSVNDEADSLMRESDEIKEREKTENATQKKEEKRKGQEYKIKRCKEEWKMKEG